MDICYYVTGHGLGHATRSVEIIYQVLTSLPQVRNVYVVTSVPRQFFVDNITYCNNNTTTTTTTNNNNNNSSSSSSSKRVINNEHATTESLLDRLFVRECDFDSGAVQLNPLQVDCRSTILSYYTKIHLNRDAIISAEAEFLRNANIKLILVDATPLAGSIGDFVGIKTILISNFLWSYCYEGMYKILKENGEAALMSDTLSMDDAEMMIEACKKDYDRVSMLLQLPGSCPLHDSFPLEKIFKGPLVHRSNKLSPQQVREQLKIDASAKLILLGFGGHINSDWNLKDDFLPPGYVCMVVAAPMEALPQNDRWKAIPYSCYLPDMINAADIIIGKVGYGYVSEVLGHRKVMVYVPRTGWPEEDALVENLQRYGCAVRLEADAYANGDWSQAIAGARAIIDSGTVVSRFADGCDYSDDWRGRVIQKLTEFL